MTLGNSYIAGLNFSCRSQILSTHKLPQLEFNRGGIVQKGGIGCYPPVSKCLYMGLPLKSLLSRRIGLVIVPNLQRCIGLMERVKVGMGVGTKRRISERGHENIGRAPCIG